MHQLPHKEELNLSIWKKIIKIKLYNTKHRREVESYEVLMEKIAPELVLLYKKLMRNLVKFIFCDLKMSLPMEEVTVNASMWS